MAKSHQNLYPALTSRKAAKSLGLKYYFTGSECVNGNRAMRLVSSYHCLCEKCTHASRAASKRSYEKNKDYYNECSREFYHKNKKDISEKQAARRRENPQVYSEKTSRNRARKIKRTPPWVGELDYLLFSVAHELAKERMSATGIKWHVDHMFPLKGKSVSGLHCAGNIQVIPAEINFKKQNRMMLTTRNSWLGLV